MKGHPRKVSVSYSHVTDEFLHQFIGLFLADGSFTSGGGHPAMKINLRSDDLPLLLAIKDQLGGLVFTYDPKTGLNSKPQARWALQGYSRVGPLVTLMLDTAILPSRKLEQARIVKEWCEWRADYGCFLGEEGHQMVQEFRKRLSVSKVFKVRG